MSCNEKSAFGEKFEDNSATNRFHENDENSIATFTGNIENSETYPENGAQSTPYLGLFKTLIHDFRKYALNRSSGISLLFRLFNFANKNSRDSKWRIY